MLIIKNIKSINSKINSLKRSGRSIGFVPTMGALHEGHLSIMRRARRQNDIVVVSVFVNPKQFGLNEDFARYPRQEKKDHLLAKKEKVDIIFYPSIEEIYPTRYLTYINVEGISRILCGHDRPVHFKGVTTIVGKLLNLVRPDNLYLGQKDAQQVIVLRKMIVDLNFPVKVRVCPIVREPDGLALSSRNKYLTNQQRLESPVLFQALKKAKIKALKENVSVKGVLNLMKSNITKNSSGSIDYIACVDADSLVPLDVIKGRVMIALAVKFGKTRLIDNIVFRKDDGKKK